MTRTSASEWGFTLLEVLLVMAILAMASLVVVPNLGRLDVRTFGAQVREATALLNYARRLAVVEGQPATARLHPGTRDDDTDPDGGDLPPAAAEWFSGATRLSYEDSTEQVTDVDAPLDLVFFPEGGSTGGVLILRNDDREARIVVDPFTGRVTLADLDEG